jgi:hypothetical protein
MSSNGKKNYAIGNFIKFGGPMVVHHNLQMLEDFLLVGITSFLIKGVHLPCLEVSHDPPLHTIDEAVGIHCNVALETSLFIFLSMCGTYIKDVDLCGTLTFGHMLIKISHVSHIKQARWHFHIGTHIIKISHASHIKQAMWHFHIGTHVNKK